MNTHHALQKTSMFSENKAERTADGADIVRTRRFMLKLLSGSLALALTPATIASAADLLLTDNQGKTMKIVMLTGSPHRQGTSALLADEFIAGASSKGHVVVRFDTAFEKVGPCRACYYCNEHDGTCIQQDAMQKILPEVLSADMLVLVTPLYYYNMTAQLKTVIDRMMPQREALRKRRMKTAMLVTCGSNTDWNMDAIMAQYKVLQQYLPWEDQGVVLAKHVFARKDIEGTAYPAAARALGSSL